MRLSIEQSVLLPALATVTRALPSRVVRPVLSAVALTARDGTLTLAATDLETAAVTRVTADVTAEGVVAVPGKVLQEAVRRLPAGVLTMEALPGGSGARIVGGKAQLTIQGFQPEEFPAVPAFPDTADRSVPQVTLRRVIQQSAFAAAQSETARALLRGVELRFAPEGVFALATDGFQVASYTSQPGAERPSDGAVVVLAEVLLEVARVLGDSEEPCEVAFQGNRLLFRSGPTYLATRVLEGKYFAVLDMLPKEFPTTVRVGRDAFTGACERVGLVTENLAPHTLMLEVAEHGLRLWARNGNVGEAEEEVGAVVQGPALSVGFNGRQLVQGLRHFGGEDVLFEFSGPETAARLTDPADGRLEYVQMPLQLRSPTEPESSER